MSLPFFDHSRHFPNESYVNYYCVQPSSFPSWVDHPENIDVVFQSGVNSNGVHQSAQEHEPDLQNLVHGVDYEKVSEVRQ